MEATQFTLHVVTFLFCRRVSRCYKRQCSSVSGPFSPFGRKCYLTKSISHCAADRMSSAKQIVKHYKLVHVDLLHARVVPTLSSPFSPS